MSSSSSPSGHDDGSFAQEARTQTVKAVILIVVAVAVAVVLLHRQPSSGTAVTTKASAPPPTAVVPTTATTVPPTSIPPAQVKVLVLNGTLKGNLAGELTSHLKSNPGYNTLIPDNTTSAVQSSSVYAVTSQYVAEANAIATSLGLPPSSVVTNVPANVPISRAEQTEANVVVVIGPDLASRLPSITGSSSSSSGSSGSGTNASSTTTTTTGRTSTTTGKK